MTHTEQFCREYRAVLDGLELPERVGLVYEPVALLAERGGRSVWKLRRRCDGAPFVLKAASGEGENLEEEFRLLTRLYPALAGAAPLAADCFAQGERHYLVRSFLPGQTLAQWREKAGGCTEEQCVSIGRKVCALLERLHALEPPVIHRDIKPENIVLGEDGAVGLIDFGIARQYKPERESDTRLMGSRSTAPPEQYGFAQTDGRADLYALGATLSWLLTGSYERDALEGAPVSRRLRRVLAKAAAFSPADRYPTAAALGRALRGPERRRGLRIALAGAACAALCLGLGGLALSGRQGARAVAFSSACLEKAVRAELEMPAGEITYADLEGVERLALVGWETFGAETAYDYRLESTLDSVSQYAAPAGDVSDLTLLSHMPNLKELYLCQQAITDISPLAGLELEVLALSDNQITDLSPLAGMDSLEELWLGGNPVTDASPLAGLGRLRLLNLSAGHGEDTGLDSLSFLAELPLDTLSLARRTVSGGDWFPLAALGALDELFLWSPPAEALEASAGLDYLAVLELGDAGLEDLTVLAGCPVVDLRIHGGLAGLEGAENLPSLRNLSVFDCTAADLSPLAGCTGLETFSFSGLDGVEDFSVLSTLPRLHGVLVPQARVEDIAADCPGAAFAITGQ